MVMPAFGVPKQRVSPMALLPLPEPLYGVAGGIAWVGTASCASGQCSRGLHRVVVTAT